MPENCKHWQGIIAEQALTNPRPIDPDLDAHLFTCADCTTVFAEFEATVAALAQATPIPGVSLSAPAGLDARIMRQLNQAQHQRRTRRTVFALCGTVAAAVLLVITVASLGDSTRPTPDQIALVAGGIDGNATLETRAWGTQIHLTGRGFKAGQQYNLWLEQPDGTHVSAGTFIGVRNTKITVSLASALPAVEAVAIGISEPGGAVIVRADIE